MYQLLFCLPSSQQKWIKQKKDNTVQCMHACLCVCACVCWERDRQTETDSQRDRNRDRDRETECVCVCSRQGRDILSTLPEDECQARHNGNINLLYNEKWPLSNGYPLTMSPCWQCLLCVNSPSLMVILCVRGWRSARSLVVMGRRWSRVMIWWRELRASWNPADQPPSVPRSFL